MCRQAAVDGLEQPLIKAHRRSDDAESMPPMLCYREQVTYLSTRHVSRDLTFCRRPRPDLLLAFCNRFSLVTLGGDDGYDGSAPLRAVCF